MSPGQVQVSSGPGSDQFKSRSGSGSGPAQNKPGSKGADELCPAERG